MHQKIEALLYIDIQVCAAEKICPRCGGSVYAPGWHCLRCERRTP